MTVTALWIPLGVPDGARFDASARFYRELLGLPEVDRWDRDGEQGRVYAAGGDGRIEIVHPPQRSAVTPPGVPPIALELPDRALVDRHYDRLRNHAVTRPAAFPRGHYGFTATDPAGHPVLLWTEAAR